MSIDWQNDPELAETVPKPKYGPEFIEPMFE